jgi:N6-L-threonylcarbamoyladenine synthase
MKAHVLAHFIDEKDKNPPEFPFICLTVSGGHTQIVLVNSFTEMQIVGTTLDDAAGEAFDKSAKVLGLEYPGGPLIDKYSKSGNINAFTFGKPKIKDLDFSFSGLKTSIMNKINSSLMSNPKFIEENLNDLCASIQHSIIQILLDKVEKAIIKTKVNRIAIAGGVSANSYLRKQLQLLGQKLNFEVHIPKFEYCTDNAAMIAMAGAIKYEYGNNSYKDYSEQASARLSF